jgi:hypothetical protein
MLNRWAVFMKRAEAYLLAESKGHLNKMRCHGEFLESCYEKDSDLVWDQGYFKERVEVMMDPENERHNPHSPSCCIAIHARDGNFNSVITDGQDCEAPDPSSIPVDETTDDIIFDQVQHDVTMLFDPCVMKRLWIADRHADGVFLKKLGDAIAGSVKEFDDTRNGFGYLRLFLCELEAEGVVLLSNPSDIIDEINDEKLSDDEFYQEEWEKAFQIVKEIINEPCPIKGLSELKQFLNVNQFRKHFGLWFNSVVTYHDSGRDGRTGKTGAELRKTIRREQRKSKGLTSPK